MRETVFFAITQSELNGLVEGFNQIFIAHGWEPDPWGPLLVEQLLDADT